MGFIKSARVGSRALDQAYKIVAQIRLECQSLCGGQPDINGLSRVIAGKRIPVVYDYSGLTAGSAASDDDAWRYSIPKFQHFYYRMPSTSCFLPHLFTDRVMCIVYFYPLLEDFLVSISRKMSSNSEILSVFSSARQMLRCCYVHSVMQRPTIARE